MEAQKPILVMTLPQALSAQLERLEALRIRMDVLVLGHQRMKEELKDNPVRHLVRCACGRMDTRFDCCPTCMMERLRKEML